MDHDVIFGDWKYEDLITDLARSAMSAFFLRREARKSEAKTWLLFDLRCVLKATTILSVNL